MPEGCIPVMSDIDTSSAPLTKAEARRITDQLKSGLEKLWPLIEQAYFGRAWDALGYKSWDAYLDGEFGTYRLRLPREERDEVVNSLHAAGMSVRAIAAATGDSKSTVAEITRGVQNRTAATTGTDGKKYGPKVAKDPKPKAEPKALVGSYPTPPPLGEGPHDLERMPKPASTERIRRVPAPESYEGTDWEQQLGAINVHLNAAMAAAGALTPEVLRGIPAERRLAESRSLNDHFAWILDLAEALKV